MEIKVSRTGDWAIARRVLGLMPQRLRDAADRAAADEARRAHGEVDRGLATGAPGGQRLPPISATTRIARRLQGISSATPLVRTGEMRRAVAVHRLGPARYAVGIRDPRIAETARRQTAGFGPVAVRMTPKMRKFLFGVLFRGLPRRQGSGRPGVVVVRVRPRPFMEPAVAASRRGAAIRITAVVARSVLRR